MNLQILELMVSSGLLILIWLIQVLHYPAFRYVDRSTFSQFAKFHSSRISIIVIPLMFLELGLAIYNPRPLILTLVTGIWLSTFLLQVPCHNKLTQSYDGRIVDRLISTNWIRTALWTLKTFILIRGL